MRYVTCFAALAVVVAGSLFAVPASAEDAMRSDSMKADHMKPDAMHSDSMKSDHMGTDAPSGTQK